MAHAIDEARRRGAKRLTILSDPYAVRIYERNGARLIGEAPIYSMTSSAPTRSKAADIGPLNTSWTFGARYLLRQQLAYPNSG
jgi:hypothetical protein